MADFDFYTDPDDAKDIPLTRVELRGSTIVLHFGPSEHIGDYVELHLDPRDTDMLLRRCQQISGGP